MADDLELLRLKAQAERERAAAQQAASGEQRTPYLSGMAMARNPQGYLTSREPPPFRVVDDAVRAAADMLSMGTADEIAAAGDTLTGDGSYTENLETQRERDRQGDPGARLAGSLAGAGTLGVGMARKGLTLMNTARPTVGNMALRGGAEGAGYGAAYGFGSGEGGQDRLGKTIYGGLLGAGTGAAMGAVGAGLSSRAAKPPSTAGLRKQAGQAYKALDENTVIIRPDKFRGMVDDLQRELAEEGIDKGLDARALRAFERLKDASGDNITLKGTEILRRVINKARDGAGSGERRLLGIMRDRLDEFVSGIDQADVLTNADPKAVTESLKAARTLWGRQAKAETVERLIERAQRRSKQFTGSGYENALRTEFRNMANNERRMRFFSPAERKAIERVAQGGPIGNLMRAIGRFAPRGPVSTGFGVGAAALDPVTGLGAMAAGEIGRQGATMATSRNARIAQELMQRGGPAVRSQLTPQQQQMIEALITTGALGGQKVPAPY